MKKNKRLFCDLMATGLYDGFRAVETVWGDKYDDSYKEGQRLLCEPKIIRRIKLLSDSNEKMATNNAVWTKNVLMGLVERAGVMEDGVYDPNVIRYALDMLNKMNGAYEKDNQQKADVSLTMQF